MTQGVEYLHALYQCRELSAAVVRFGGQKTLSNIERSIGAGEAVGGTGCGGALLPHCVRQTLGWQWDGALAPADVEFRIVYKFFLTLWMVFRRKVQHRPLLRKLCSGYS